MTLRVGTDCSGLESPLLALRSLGVPYEHVFSSEIDKRCVKLIKANFSPRILFGDPDGPFPEGDITKRDLRDVPGIDVYICGFPCQPFSKCGKRGGFEDPRGNVFFACVELIRRKKPRYFVLENVPGILSHARGETWAVIEEHLAALERECGYRVEWRLLNSRLHAGVPQNRPRIYIVGTLAGDIRWPEQCEMAPLRDYINWDNTKSRPMPPSLERIWPQIEGCGLWLLNVNAFPAQLAANGKLRTMQAGRPGFWAPCMCATQRYWCLPLSRFLTGAEVLGLQGIEAHRLRGLSDYHARFRAGNAMTVPLLARIFRGLGIGRA